MKYIPTPQADGLGASLVGNSYISMFAQCPRYWFNTNYRPMLAPDGTTVGRGLQPVLTPAPLLTGRLLHEGLATLYESGVRDGEDTGEWIIDRAITTMQTHWAKAVNANEYESNEAAQADWNTLEMTLRGYYDRFGPGSHAPDFPDIRVQCDHEGRPLVEREFLVDLGYGGYFYTCRADAVVSHRGHLRVLEHKSASAYGVRYQKASVPTAPQFSGEVYVLQAAFPSDPVDGVLLNIILKDRSKASKYDIAERDTALRTPAQLERWYRGTINVLRQIDEAVGRFEELRTAGHDIEYAADVAFPPHGTYTGKCHAYQRDCQFIDLCRLPGLESSLLNRFRHRTEAELERLKTGRLDTNGTE